MNTAKQIVGEYMEEVWVKKDLDALGRYISTEKFIQHNPNIDNGLEALKDFLPYLFGTFIPGFSWQVVRLIAEEDIVVAHSLMLTTDYKRTAVVDIFRVQGGKIVEHWDVAHEIPNTSKNGNPVV